MSEYMCGVIDREAVKEAARAAAFDEGKDCPHCGGSGKVSGGRRVVHSIRGVFGADWDIEAVLVRIDAARAVTWTSGGHLGHDLVITESDGSRIAFAVPAPVEQGGGS